MEGINISEIFTLSGTSEAVKMERSSPEIGPPTSGEICHSVFSESQELNVPGTNEGLHSEILSGFEMLKQNLEQLTSEIRNVKVDVKRELKQLTYEVKHSTVAIQNLKSEVQQLKNEIKGSQQGHQTTKFENRSIENGSALLENPFDVLDRFGFKANSLDELLERERLFSQGEDAKKNKDLLLRTLIQISPKPETKRVTCVDVIRSSMKRMADVAVWQYFSARGRSGTKKITMETTLPSLMNVVIVTTMNVMKVDPKEAGSALSNFLKSASHRASSKRRLAEAFDENHLDANTSLDT